MVLRHSTAKWDERGWLFYPYDEEQDQMWTNDGLTYWCIYVSNILNEIRQTLTNASYTTSWDLCTSEIKFENELLTCLLYRSEVTTWSHRMLTTYIYGWICPKRGEIKCYIYLYLLHSLNRGILRLTKWPATTTCICILLAKLCLTQTLSVAEITLPCVRLIKAIFV